MKKKAIIYTENTENLLDLANFLIQDDWEIISAGDTAEFFSKNLIPYTLDRSLSSTIKTSEGYTHLVNLVLNAKSSERIDNFDFEDSAGLVCINVKPRYHEYKRYVEETTTEELIDVKHISIIRSAALNHQNVVVLTDPQDYHEAIIQLKTDSISKQFRLYLAGKALNLTSAYDAACSVSILRGYGQNYAPEYFMVPYRKELKFSQGTNAHQSAYLYTLADPHSALTGLKKIQGKELDYTIIRNYFEVLRVVSLFIRIIKNPSQVESTDSENYAFSTQFTPASGSVFTIISKNLNPIGASLGPDVAQSIRKSVLGDPEKCINAVLGSSAVIDEEAAREILNLRLIAIIAPDFTKEAREILAENKTIRLIVASKLINGHTEVSSVDGGLLVQTVDDILFKKWHVVTKKRPTQLQIDALQFGMMLVLASKSDSACVINDFSTIGLATGQAHRRRALISVLNEAQENINKGLTSDNKDAEILVTDSSIPFEDRFRNIADLGIKAIIQTGGSENDQAFIDYCNEREIAMVFTGIKHLNY